MSPLLPASSSSESPALDVVLRFYDPSRDNHPIQVSHKPGSLKSFLEARQAQSGALLISRESSGPAHTRFIPKDLLQSSGYRFFPGELVELDRQPPRIIPILCFLDMPRSVAETWAECFQANLSFIQTASGAASLGFNSLPLASL